MAIALVNTYENNGGTTGDSGATVAISGATANNLLVAIVIIRTSTGSTVFTDPFGWTLLGDAEGGSAVACRAYYRIADGTIDDNFDPLWDSTKRWAAGAIELSGVDTSSPIDVTNDNTTQTSGTQTSIQTGSVTPTAATFAVAWLGMNKTAAHTDGVTDPFTVNSSFTEAGDIGAEDANVAFGGFAYLSLSGTSALNPTFTLDATYANAVGAYAGIAVLNEASGGAWTISNIDLDDSVSDGQTGTVIALTGTVAASGKKVFISQGANTVEQTVTAEDSSSVTITVSYGGTLSAGAATLYVQNPL